MNTDEWIQIIFEFETAHGLFRDALYLPADHTYTDEEINAMKQQRLDNWVAMITTLLVEQPIQGNAEEPYPNGE